MLEILGIVVETIEDKKGADIVVLDLADVAFFTDYFVISTGTSSRQLQTISDEIQERLGKSGLWPSHLEGYNVAEWILLDYVDFVVHLFSQSARTFYDLERLWRDARRIEPAELLRTKRRRVRKSRK